MSTIAFSTSEHIHLWETLTGDDDGAPLELPKGGPQVAVQATGDFGGGTLTMQASLDGVTWATLLTGPGGSGVTFDAAGYAEISTAARYIRPLADSSISDVDVHARVLL
jgi:hypothetical protein